jgi:hypothetical protein
MISHGRLLTLKSNSTSCLSLLPYQSFGQNINIAPCSMIDDASQASQFWVRTYASVIMSYYFKYLYLAQMLVWYTSDTDRNGFITFIGSYESELQGTHYTTDVVDGYVLG